MYYPGCCRFLDEIDKIKTVIKMSLRIIVFCCRLHTSIETTTKVFRNAWHEKQTYACSSDIENVPVDAWMLEHRYSMYAPKIDHASYIVGSVSNKRNKF